MDIIGSIMTAFNADPLGGGLLFGIGFILGAIVAFAGSQMMMGGGMI